MVHAGNPSKRYRYKTERSRGGVYTRYFSEGGGLYMVAERTLIGIPGGPH
jgi:hypothetical protein